MAEQKRQLRLGVFLQANGHHIAAWRHPGANADLGVSFAQYKELAQKAEAAKFDMIFLADGVAVRENADNTESMSRSGRAVTFEPLTLYSALAAVTEHIGFVATASTTYNEPYHVARKFASLDHMSGGRSGWNVVTSASDAEARNFGLEKHVEHGKRYQRAEEFVDVVTKLWDSWEDDSFLRDKASSRFLIPKNCTRNQPQRRRFFPWRGPHQRGAFAAGLAEVVVQAGASEPGRELAARTGEVIFTAQQTLEDAQKFYASVKGRMPKYGRRPEQLLVMPGIFPVIGATQAEAEAKYKQLQDLVHPAQGLQMLRNIAPGVDLSKIDLDGPLPDDLPETNGGKSRQALLRGMAARDNLTIRQLFLKVAGARGHFTIVGTPKSIVDTLEQWFVEGGADGFNIMPPYLPGGLDEFIELVLPELRRRGLFRSEYEGRTLRENLGLARPENQFAVARGAALRA